MRTAVCGLSAATRPCSSANGATPASMLPQLGEVSTVALSTDTWANRYSTSMPGRPEADTITTLLDSESPPPRPSIWRRSGEPITASSTWLRRASSCGKSLCRKNGPLDVPPRITTQGMGINMAVTSVDGSFTGHSRHCHAAREMNLFLVLMRFIQLLRLVRIGFHHLVQCLRSRRQLGGLAGNQHQATRYHRVLQPHHADVRVGVALQGQPRQHRGANAFCHQPQ